MLSRQFSPVRASLAAFPGRLFRKSARSQAVPALHVELQRVLALEDLERFVFVMSVLEGYSEKECSLLLGCSPLEVHDARTRALDYIAAQNSSAVFEAQVNGGIATDAATMGEPHFVQARSF